MCKQIRICTFNIIYSHWNPESCCRLYPLTVLSFVHSNICYHHASYFLNYMANCTSFHILLKIVWYRPSRVDSFRICSLEHQYTDIHYTISIWFAVVHIPHEHRIGFFIEGLGCYWTASTVSIWYFSEGSPEHPILRSICFSLKQLGSIAFGSLLIAVVVFIRMVL